MRVKGVNKVQRQKCLKTRGMDKNLFYRPNLVLQALVIRQQVIEAVFAQYAAFEVLGQLAGLVGFEVLAPVFVIISLQLGNVVFYFGEVLEGAFQSLDRSLAFVEEGFHIGNAFCLCHDAAFL